jgi:hypothetical protein
MRLKYLKQFSQILICGNLLNHVQKNRRMSKVEDFLTKEDEQNC